MPLGGSVRGLATGERDNHPATMNRFGVRFRRIPWLVALVGYVAVTIVVLWPSIRPGRALVPADVITAVSPYREADGGFNADNPLLSDPPFQFYPWMVFLGEELRDGRLPRWNPTILGGVPVTPNGFVSPYYPGFWLVAVLGPLNAYNIFVALHLVVGALGLYALSRTLGAPPGAAWVGGLVSFVAGSWIHWSMHLSQLVGFVWLPWALAVTHRLIERPSLGRVAQLGLVFGIWWLGGNPQYVYLGTLTLLAYALVLLAVRRTRGAPLAPPAGAVLVGLLLGAALAAPVLLPTVSTADDILRQAEPVESLTQTHLSAGDAIRVLVPDARGNAADGVQYEGYLGEWDMDSPFLGAAVVPLVAVAVGGGWRRRRVWLLGGAALVLVLAFTPWLHPPLHAVLPGYDRFRVSARWIVILPALVAPLAALGVTDLLRGSRGTRRRLLIAAAVCGTALAVFLGNVVADRSAPQEYFGARVVAAAVPVAAVVAVGLIANRIRLVLALLTPILLAEALFHSTRWFPSVEEAGAYPRLPLVRTLEGRDGRLVHLGPDTLAIYAFGPNLPMVYGIEDVQGIAVLFPQQTDRYLRAIDDYGTFALELNTAPPVTDPTALRSPLLDALDVRTVVASGRVEVPAEYPLLMPGEPRAYSRASPGAAYLAPRASPATEESMWEAIQEPAWDPRESSYVMGLERPIRGGTGEVTLLARDGDLERWRVASEQGGFLRVSGAFHPGWSAWIDGAEARVLRADGMFRGVVVPPGRHDISFRFRNPPEEVGRWIAIVAALLIAGLILSMRLGRTAGSHHRGDRTGPTPSPTRRR